MKFFFPDSHDYVDPDFDFEADCSPPERERYRTDLYAHEIFDRPPYDGLLVSKSIVDGAGDKPGKYTVAQRHRLQRLGVHRFFRVEHLKSEDGSPFPIMGDCGAFSYVSEPEPPISVTEALEFYELCGFTHAQSIDHVIKDFNPEWDTTGLFESGPPDEVKRRFDLTLRLAEEFLSEHHRRRCSFSAVGVAQGWSPTSYRSAVVRLQRMGYDYIALGGLVPLRTEQLITVVREVMPVVDAGVRIHLLGVMRWDYLDEILTLGVASVDTTSPLRQAFLDSTNNYYPPHATTKAYTALRVPQVDGNAKIKREISSGALELETVRDLERRCLESVRACANGSGELETTLNELDAYGRLLDPRADRRAKASRMLVDRPWEECPCAICREIGVEVAIFRGANRNRRRGFHNLYVTYERLQRALVRLSNSNDRAMNVG